MKKILLAVIFILGTAASAQARSVWLILKEGIFMKGPVFSIDLEKIEMKNMEQCEEQGAIFIASKRMGQGRGKHVGFECLEGK